ncbi:hypothetical protein [Pilimelia columellifera]|uniref:hypothetical protein n=1 Tax=Pilimelia columellifera TaxID=706574 RepID=UPI0031D66B91
MTKVRMVVSLGVVLWAASPLLAVAGLLSYPTSFFLGTTVLLACRLIADHIAKKAGLRGVVFREPDRDK